MTKELTILVKPGTSKIMAMIIEEESLAQPCSGLLSLAGPEIYRVFPGNFTLHFESNQSFVQQSVQIIKNETHHAMKPGTSIIIAVIIEEESLAQPGLEIYPAS